jgi:hypothetical protein
MLSGWTDFAHYVDDGRICLTNNTALIDQAQPLWSRASRKAKNRIVDLVLLDIHPLISPRTINKIPQPSSDRWYVVSTKDETCIRCRFMSEKGLLRRVRLAPHFGYSQRTTDR